MNIIDDKQALRQLKTETSQSLAQLDLSPYAKVLDAVDARLIIYIEGVCRDPEGHNLYEQLAIKRFFYMLSKYELRAIAVQIFITVYEFLKFPSDEGMRSFCLTPVQVFQFASILGFYYHGTNRRVVTEALLFVPRKFSKTTSVASLAVYDLLYGDANAQCFVAANSYDQAQICFSVIKNILNALDPSFRRFKTNREIVYNLMRGRTSFSRCLASKPDKLDGLNASLVIVDEYAQATSDAQKNVLTSSMGARKNPLTVVITTGSDKKDTPFVEELSAHKAILRGEMDNDSMFAHIFEPDVDDEEGDPRTWYKVQPHLGITCREEFYADKWAKAQMSSGNMREFRTKLLNLFVRDDKDVWIPRDTIEELMLSVPSERLRGAVAMVAVDLSVSDDFSAVTYLIYTPNRKEPGREGEQTFHSITEYYFPEGQLETHVNRELYKRWADEGYLKLCRGSVVDYEQIAQDILAKPYDMKALGYDPYKSLDFIRQLEYTIGKQYLYKVAQTYGNFTSPVESLELCVFTGRITFDPNPITAYCFANAIIDSDHNENRKPIKALPKDKIDGAITNVMGFWLMNNVALAR